MALGPDARPELVKRFRAEAVSAASLHHPNIVAIHEVGLHEGQHFFVMDYVEGQNLARLVATNRCRRGARRLISRPSPRRCTTPINAASLWQQCQSEAEAPIDKLPGPIHSLEVSPDGHWLLAGSIGGEPRLWHLATAEPVRVAGEADWAFGAFSPDSRWLVLCAETTRLFGRILSCQCPDAALATARPSSALQPRASAHPTG
ncbi:MAG TPA: hypothetical protein P5555_15375 [Candidatus Paceibacterota bacterium]|nr:hypothetical protein [Candidatus Paceibacterota bacterium]